MSQREHTPFSHLISFSKPYKAEFLKASMESALNKFFDLAPPVLIGLAVDLVNGELNNYSILKGYNFQEKLLLLIFLTIIIWVLESVFEYKWQKSWMKVAQNIQHNMRVDLYSKVQDLDYEDVVSSKSGELMSVLNEDVNQLERFICTGINELVQLIITVVSVGVVFFLINSKLALYSFLPIPFIVFGSIKFQKYLGPLYYKIRNSAGMLSGEISNNLGGLITIRSFNGEKKEVKRISKLSFDYANQNIEMVKTSALFTPLIRMVIMISFLVNLFLGAMLVKEGTLSVGEYSITIFIIQRLLWPLTRLGQTLDLFQRAMSSVARIFKLKNTDVSIKSGQKDIAIKDEIDSIQIKSLNFSYRTGLQVIKDLNLLVKKDQTIGIVGTTGSGKSTLMKLLMRFIDPLSGEILINDQKINELKFSELRTLFGYVGQDHYLFHGTIFENVRYARPSATLLEVEEALEKTHALDFVKELPNGIQTIIGERGQKLSGGQRQRISLARAILKNPKILILDEATSNVDNETEWAIQKSLETITQNRVTFIIAHRLSTIVKAQNIIVLKNGSIVESGIHEDLINKKGEYYRLWNVQTGMSD